ncbi:MAG TPA: alpha/beta hydrolase, partial [Acidobacteriota bacterium]|nr:alpha/beta hydrolase [Acidobacteriota bacterium]
MNFTHRTLPVNGISLHVVEAGPEDGSPVFLLHGFPDFWRTWEKQMEFLAQQGFRAIAPDQRGYNLSDKPAPLAAYNIDQLAGDVTALMDAYGYPRATVIGHDWGGSVAWRTAHLFPDRIEKLVILNVPHSTVMKRALRTGWRQRMRSWYIFLFQIPRIP